MSSATTTPGGGREALIALFEREFIESQEALGSRVVATFRDLDVPDRFVWIRSFESQATRAAALDGFYTSDLWRARRSEANASIVDSDNVLQLRLLSGDPLRDAPPRAAIGATALPRTLFIATTYFLPPRTDDAFAAFFAERIAPILQRSEADFVAAFATEHSPNPYPRLPVRNETVLLTLTRFPSPAAYDAHKAALERDPDWRAATSEITRRTIAPPEVMRRQPTARSWLR